MQFFCLTWYWYMSQLRVLFLQTDTSRPLEFPTTPDLILDYHRQKPFLNNNEEWLVVELNEYECLVETIEILRIIAKHSKFFEVGQSDGN